MANSSFEQFRQIVFQDATLQRELHELVDPNEFIARVVALGAARGFDFNTKDVQQAMTDGRRAWIERHI